MVNLQDINIGDEFSIEEGQESHVVLTIVSGRKSKIYLFA